MTFLPISLGLIAALFWGAADFCGGIASRRSSVFTALLIAELGGWFLLAPLPFVFAEAFPPLEVILFSALAGLGGIVGLFLLYKALAEGQMSIAAPVSGLVGASIPVIYSAAIYGLPALITFSGFLLAGVAIWLISVGENHGKSLEFHGKVLLLPALAGLAFGAYFIFIHVATEQYAFWPMLFSRTFATVFLLAYMLATRQSFKISGSPLWIAALGGSLDVIANSSYVFGAQFGRLDIAAVLGSLYPGGTVLLAWWLLKEHLTRVQQAGVVAALIAIVLIAI
jgi:drug/metabolite transporter (DMT)-like permease